MTIQDKPEHSYEAIRTDIVSALAADGFAYLEAESLILMYEAHIQAKALRDAADWVEELAVHDGLMYKVDEDGEYESFSIPDALRDRADYLEKNS